MHTSQAALFEDPWADASMRRTIPLFAALGAGAVLLTAPFITGDGQRRLGLVGVAAVALLSAGVLRVRNLIDRLPREVVFLVLTFYCVIIATVVVVAGRLDAPYRLFYVLPVTFAGAFFTGRVRFGMVPIAVGIDWILLSRFLSLNPVDSATRLVIMFLLALFSAMVADILREALRTNRALHAVLEASSRNPLADELARIGVEAALAVADWDAGAVLLVDGDHFRITAMRGASEALADAYERHPVAVAADTMVPAAHRLGVIQYVADVEAELGATSPIVVDGFTCAAAIPLTYHDEGIGVLVVAHRTPKRVEGRQRDRLERVSRQLSLALGSARAWRLEEALVEELRSLNRHKDEFLANVSHELRTPATAISLITATIGRSGDRLSDQQRAEMFATLERRSDELCELIENLLDESIAEAGLLRLATQEIEWGHSLRAWASTVANQTGRVIEVDLPSTPIDATVDPVKVERIVVNLLVNAAKFSEPGTRIVLGAAVDGPDAVISVTDEGVGVAATELETIFERFRQVDSTTTRSVGGFGIGLSLVRSYAEAHGGSVRVQSEPGRGSTFTVRLPLHRPEHRPATVLP